MTNEVVKLIKVQSACQIFHILKGSHQDNAAEINQRQPSGAIVCRMLVIWCYMYIYIYTFIYIYMYIYIYTYHCLSIYIYLSIYPSIFLYIYNIYREPPPWHNIFPGSRPSTWAWRLRPRSSCKPRAVTSTYATATGDGERETGKRRQRVSTETVDDWGPKNGWFHREDEWTWWLVQWIGWWDPIFRQTLRWRFPFRHDGVLPVIIHLEDSLEDLRRFPKSWGMYPQIIHLMFRFSLKSTNHLKG